MEMLVDLGELILCAREADLQSFNLAEPAFAASAIRAMRLSRMSISRPVDPGQVGAVSI